MPAYLAIRSALNLMRQVVRKSRTSWPVEPLICCLICGADVPEIESPHHPNCAITKAETQLAELEKA